jgi:hypothetical protein
MGSQQQGYPTRQMKVNPLVVYVVALSIPISLFTPGVKPPPEEILARE